MKATKAPHLQQGGTVTKDVRSERELAVVANLEWLQRNDSARFARAMQLLASLVTQARRERKVE